MENVIDPAVILRDRLQTWMEQIEGFCDRWHITEFSLFGSVLREDFHPETSDVDVLVSFAPDARKGLTEWLQMKEELEALFNRKVDFVSKTAVQESHNWLRKRNILNSALVLYEGRSIERMEHPADPLENFAGATTHGRLAQAIDIELYELLS